MKFRRTKLPLIAGGAILLVLLSYRVFGKSVRYEIPGGFKGWLRLQWSYSSCPPLAREGVFLIVKVTPSGQFCTSSRVPADFVYQKFEYVYRDGVRQSLRWDDHGESGSQVWLEGYDEQLKDELIFAGEEHGNWNLYPRPH